MLYVDIVQHCIAENDLTVTLNEWSPSEKVLVIQAEREGSASGRRIQKYPFLSGYSIGRHFFKDLLGYPHQQVSVSPPQVGLPALLVPENSLLQSSDGLSAI